MAQVKQGFVHKFNHDDVFRCKTFLFISMAWSLLQCLYNLTAGLYTNSSYIWWFGIACWFCIVFFFKLALWINSNRMTKNKKHASFKILAIVYLFINSTLIFTITITPACVTSVFLEKIYAFNIVSVILNLISTGIFISSWWPVKKEKFTIDQYSFVKAREYIGRSEGFFTVLLVTLNILIIIRDYAHVDISNSTFVFTYLAIGCACAIYSLALAIWLCKTKRFNIKK